MDDTSDAARRRTIAIRAEPDAHECSADEPFALRVLGDSMRPEFDDGDVVVVEPEGIAGDGSFVVACCNGEWMLRELRGDGDGWRLAALDPAYPEVAIPDLAPVRGVVIQRAKPGRRRMTKRYVD
jgi:SOS-response transcriptional repressor LexA